MGPSRTLFPPQGPAKARNLSRERAWLHTAAGPQEPALCLGRSKGRGFLQRFIDYCLTATPPPAPRAELCQESAAHRRSPRRSRSRRSRRLPPWRRRQWRRAGACRCPRPQRANASRSVTFCHLLPSPQRPDSALGVAGGAHDAPLLSGSCQCRFKSPQMCRSKIPQLQGVISR